MTSAPAGETAASDNHKGLAGASFRPLVAAWAACLSAHLPFTIVLSVPMANSNRPDPPPTLDLDPVTVVFIVVALLFVPLVLSGFLFQ
ncbi:MAG: hypothetical protein ACFB5Z_13565 [Elainellaceae cyanobacterium]